METKQTAVEWLMEQWEENSTSIWYSDFDKAKQMEKQQIMDAHLDAYVEMNMSFRGADRAEQYYNGTYNNLNK